MDSKIAQWGNSLAVRIPRPVAKELGLQEGQSVTLEIEGGALTLRPVKQTLTLEELLAGVTDENLHGETEWGSAVGLEVL